MTRLIAITSTILLIAACCTSPKEEENAFATKDCDFHLQTIINPSRDEIILKTCMIERSDACVLNDKACLIDAQLSCTEDFLSLKAEAIHDAREKNCYLDAPTREEI